MIGAVLENETVTNIIIMDEGQIEELSKALGHEIVDARPYGLQIGDVRQGDRWVRNADGDNLILTEQDPKDYSGYAKAMEQVEQLRTALDNSEKEKAVLTQQISTYRAQLQKAGVNLESI